MPVCGNGKIEYNEKCDCGPEDGGERKQSWPSIDKDKTNGCCDCATCQLKVGKSCSSLDKCCTDKCEVAATASKNEDKTYCYRKAHSIKDGDTTTGYCDEDVACDGTSSLCPFQNRRLATNLRMGSDCWTHLLGYGGSYKSTCWGR